MQNYDVDPELLAGFIDESLEGLEPLDVLFIELEKDPDDLELVNTVFRPVHSIKGSSAFFGLLKVKELAHKMEDLLDKIRQKKMKASPCAIGVLLPGLDLLRSMFDNLRDGKGEIDDEAGFQKIIDPIIDAFVKGDDEEVESAAVLLGDLLFKLEELRSHTQSEHIYVIDEAEEILSKIMPELVASPATLDGPDVQEKQEPVDPLSTILEILKTPIEDSLDDELSEKVRQELVWLQSVADSPETESGVAEALKEYDAFMNNIGFDALLQETLTEKMKALKETGKWKTEAIKSEDTKISKKTAENPGESEVKTERRKSDDRRSGDDRRSASKTSPEKTMRVSETNIDSFLSYVSELVVVEEMFNYLQKRLVSSSASGSIANDFKRIIETFGNLSDNLRKSILSIRTVPVRAVLQKAPRMIHDIAAVGNKKVDVQIEGDDILIDKSYIEMLDAPFTHIVRNAVDHGIETEEDRITAGKSATGNVWIAMLEAEKTMELVIKDDGKGLDYEAITKKAEEIGVIAKGQVLSEDAIVDLLFLSGVSTASEITDVSGRGVGMDVAKSNIEAAGGKIIIKSEQGRGAEFTISLPKSVSTQIMEGFLVRAGKEIYVMPMELIGESFALKDNDISTVGEKGEMVLRRGELFPILRLDTELRDCNESIEDARKSKESTAISVDICNKQYALCVDEIVGVQKVVVRNVEALPVNKELFDGAAMLGDGSVAMIIGSDGLGRLAT